MENSDWRFGVVANIKEYHIGDDGNIYRGTKAFTPGTKLYLAGKNWDNTRNTIGVIGRNRFGRVTLAFISVNCLENVRTQRIFRPLILEIIHYLEFCEGWPWWERTAADRKDAVRFVRDWHTRFADNQEGIHE